MTFQEKRKLQRRIERGIYQLYQSHKRAKAKAKKLFAAYQKTLQYADNLQEQRLLLVNANVELWKGEVKKWQRKH